MTEKEIAELRRRIRPEKSNFSRVRGCMINEKLEVISEFNGSLPLMSEIESEEILARLRKVLSGAQGRNLTDIDFTTKQVAEGEEHHLLMRLRDSRLADDDAFREFCRRAAVHAGIDGNFLILLAEDSYDVFSRSRSGDNDADSTSVFNYFICAVCPMKTTKTALSYYANESAFHSVAGDSVVAAPEMGFLFPAFDTRTTNIYGALYYTRSAADIHAPFAESVFNRPVPMAAADQRTAFSSILAETLAEECSLEVVQSIREYVVEAVAEHKENGGDEPLVMTKKDVGGVLRSCGVSEERVEAFDRRVDEEFGPGAGLRPQNVVETKTIELRTPDVVIKVAPDKGDLIKTTVIDGEKYIMIRAGDNVALDGVEIGITSEEA